MRMIYPGSKTSIRQLGKFRFMLVNSFIYCDGECQTVCLSRQFAKCLYSYATEKFSVAVQT